MSSWAYNILLSTPMISIDIIPNPMGAFKEHWICTGKQRKNIWHIFEVVPHSYLFHWKSTSRQTWHLSCWGCATHLPFLPKIHKLCKMAGRSHHIVFFFTKNPQVGTFLTEFMPHDFLFCSQTMWQGAKGIASKGIPCVFSHYNRDPTWKHPSASGPRWHSSSVSSHSIVRYFKHVVFTHPSTSPDNTLSCTLSKWYGCLVPQMDSACQ